MLRAAAARLPAAFQQRAGWIGYLHPLPERGGCVAEAAVTHRAVLDLLEAVVALARVESGEVARATSPHPDPKGIRAQITDGSKDWSCTLTTRPGLVERSS